MFWQPCGQIVQGDKETKLRHERPLQGEAVRNYQAALAAKGVPEDCIRKYGFAFCGEKVLIGAISEVKNKTNKNQNKPQHKTNKTQNKSTKNNKITRGFVDICS